MANDAEHDLPRDPNFDSYEQAPCAYVTTDAYGTIIKTNETFLRWTGHTRSDTFGKLRFVDVLNVGSRMLFETYCEPLLRMQGFLKEVSLELRTESEKPRSVLLDSTGIPDAKGVTTSFRHALFDITERKKYERELLQAKTHAQNLAGHLGFLVHAGWQFCRTLDPSQVMHTIAELSVTELADVCLVDVRENGRLVRASMRLRNAASISALENFEVSAAQTTLASSDWNELFPEDSPIPLVSPASPLASPNSSVLMAPLMRQGQHFGLITLLRSGLEKAFDAEDTVIVKQFAQLASLALDNALHHKETLQAVAAREELMSMCTHELRTPLTLLKLRTEMTLRRIKENDASVYAPETVERFFRFFDAHCHKLDQLINDMLDIARMRSGRFSLQRESVDLIALVSDVLERFAPQLTAGCQFVHDAATPLVGRWDRIRIEQIFTNLLTNAIKYGNGKPITVEIENQDGHAVLAVHDQGIGIAESDQSRVFQRGERATSEHEKQSLGLGLYLVAKLVEEHGGTIRVSSVPGQGASFFVRLPLGAFAPT